MEKCIKCGAPTGWSISDGKDITFEKYSAWIKDKNNLCIICYCKLC